MRRYHTLDRQKHTHIVCECTQHIMHDFEMNYKTRQSQALFFIDKDIPLDRELIFADRALVHFLCTLAAHPATFQTRLHINPFLW